jgi:hypothetical protein
MMPVWAALQVHRALATLLGRIAQMTDRRLHPAVISLLWAAGLALLIASPSRSLMASQPGDISPAVATIESMYVLEDAPLPLPPETPAASHALDFRFGGISDLFRAETAADGTIHLWGITDRGPNGFVEKPSRDGSSAKPLRTLPVPTFQPLLVKLALEAPAAAGKPGSLRVVEVKPIATAAICSTHPTATAAPAPIAPDATGRRRFTGCSRSFAASRASFTQ